MEKYFTNIFVWVVKVSLVFVGVFFTAQYFIDQNYEREMYKNYVPPFNDDGMCNVAVVPVNGTIGFSSQNIADMTQVGNILQGGDVDRVVSDLEYANSSERIKAVVLQIDSYGGSGTASEYLYDKVKNFQKPVVAYLREAGTSGGYMIALGADRIITGTTTDVGSIGVTSSYLNYAEKNKKEGIKYVEINTGKYKNMLDANKELNKDEVELLQKEIQTLADLFVKTVSDERGLPLEKVKELADGRSWYGFEAKELGLVDEVGNMNSVLSWIQNNIILSQEEQAIACVTNKVVN